MYNFSSKASTLLTLVRSLMSMSSGIYDEVVSEWIVSQSFPNLEESENGESVEANCSTFEDVVFECISTVDFIESQICSDVGLRVFF